MDLMEKLIVKAHLVAKRYTQNYGQDYVHTSSCN